MKTKNKILISLAVVMLIVSASVASVSATVSSEQNLNSSLESGLTGDVHNCSPLTVANGSVAAYPTCTITCNSGYSLSGISCLARSSGSSGGGGGGGSGNTFVATTTVTTTGGGSARAGYQFNNDLGIGSTGTDVVELQKILVAGGYLVMPAGVAMGTYGPMTVAAVRAYQLANGLPSVGVVGPQTRDKLNGGGMSTGAFIDLLLLLGIISPDKAASARLILGL
jgi:hypothetical protein